MTTSEKTCIKCDQQKEIFLSALRLIRARLNKIPTNKSGASKEDTEYIQSIVEFAISDVSTN